MTLPGHKFGLQISVSDDCPSHVPPLASSTVLLRVFVSDPPPQDTLQSPMFQELQ